jgi:hypothetical protein
MSRKYNFIYSKLVEDNDDVVGHIAYSLYKNEKIEFIETFKEKHGSEPTELDLEPFHISSCTKGSLERFRRMAATILEEFTNEMLGSTIKNIEESVISNHKKYLKETINEISPKGFMYGVYQSIVGALLFLLLMAGIVFAINLNKKGTTISINDSSMNVEQTIIKDSIKTDNQ